MDRSPSGQEPRGSLASRPAVFVIFLLAVGSSVAACDGSDGGSTSAATSAASRPLTRSDWTEQADTACRKTKAGEGSAAGRNLLTKGRNLLEEEETELEAISVPPTEATQIERLMKVLRSVTELMSAESRQAGRPAAGAPGRLEFDRVLTVLGTPIETMDREFTAYGAKVCGEVSLGFPAG